MTRNPRNERLLRIRRHLCLMCGKPADRLRNRPQARFCPRCQELARGKVPNWPTAALTQPQPEHHVGA